MREKWISIPRKELGMTTAIIGAGVNLILILNNCVPSVAVTLY